MSLEHEPSSEPQSQRERSEREIAMARDGEEKALARLTRAECQHADMMTRAEEEKRELLDALLCARAGACPIFFITLKPRVE